MPCPECGASGAVPRAEAEKLQRDADRVDRAKYHVDRANAAEARLADKAVEIAKLSVAYVKSEEQLDEAESQLAAVREALEEADALIEQLVVAAEDTELDGDEQFEQAKVWRAALAQGQTRRVGQLRRNYDPSVPGSLPEREETR